MPDKFIQQLPQDFEIQSHTISQGHVDALDDHYFAAEEAGKFEDASASFMAARFLSAMMSLQGAGSHFDLCEAAYEAHFSEKLKE